MIKELILAAGCFWCVESDFEKVPGVHEVTSGYAGGVTANPTYENHDGYIEAVKIEYDSSVVSFKELVNYYYDHVDYEDSEGQFCDRGYSYSPAIWVEGMEQAQLVWDLQPDQSIIPIIPEDPNFYRAEEYHQDYYKKNPLRYNYYRLRCGRDRRIEQLQNAEARELAGQNKTRLGHDISHLTPLQYEVTQKNATERSFSNKYWDNKEEGIYVDIVDGTPLYSSTDKEDSGTGWPSFTKGIDDSLLTYHDDWSWLGRRTEVRSKNADSHLGHVFKNERKGGKCIMSNCIRHCINSASLRFVPVEDLEKEGYGKYLPLFESK